MVRRILSLYKDSAITCAWCDDETLWILDFGQWKLVNFPAIPQTTIEDQQELQRHSCKCCTKKKNDDG